MKDLIEAAEFVLEEAKKGDKKEYQAFFDKALKKFGVDSPEDIPKDKKDDFFDYVDANWEGDNESDVDEAVVLEADSLGSYVKDLNAGLSKEKLEHPTVNDQDGTLTLGFKDQKAAEFASSFLTRSKFSKVTSKKSGKGWVVKATK